MRELVPIDGWADEAIAEVSAVGALHDDGLGDGVSASGQRGGECCVDDEGHSAVEGRTVAWPVGRGDDTYANPRSASLILAR